MSYIAQPGSIPAVYEFPLLRMKVGNRNSIIYLGSDFFTNLGKHMFQYADSKVVNYTVRLMQDEMRREIFRPIPQISSVLLSSTGPYQILFIGNLQAGINAHLFIGAWGMAGVCVRVTPTKSQKSGSLLNYVMWQRETSPNKIWEKDLCKYGPDYLSVGNIISMITDNSQVESCYQGGYKYEFRII